MEILLIQMKIHNKKLLITIKNFFKDYLDRKINLYTLEISVDATNNCFESDMDNEIVNEIFLFVEELDYISATYSQEEQYDAVSQEIAKINTTIDKALA